MDIESIKQINDLKKYDPKFIDFTKNQTINCKDIYEDGEIKESTISVNITSTEIEVTKENDSLKLIINPLRFLRQWEAMRGIPIGNNHYSNDWNYIIKNHVIPEDIISFTKK